MVALRDSVGPGGRNNQEDVGRVITLLRARQSQAAYSKQLVGIKIPRLDDPDAAAGVGAAVKKFQTTVQALRKPDGVVSPNGSTIFFLGGVRRDGKQIVVDLGDQNLYAFEGARLVFEFHSTSGDADNPTAVKPVLFHIFRKHKTYTSKTYGAPMNYAMFFTQDGKAIHQSNGVALTSFLKKFGVNYFGSHGCVRLAESDARSLFEWAPMNTPVFIDVSREGLP